MSDLDAEFPPYAPPKALWLVTLADLALLLVGFLVLINASRIDRAELARGLRDGFGDATQAAEPAMPVAAMTVAFAPGSATPASTAELVAWARDAARDPRVTLSITGSADGSSVDVDPATGSGAVLAADRARAIAAALAPLVRADRLSIMTSVRPGGRAGLVTFAFAGDPVRSSVK